MPDMSLAFPGRYMKAADLPQPKILTITNVEQGTYQDGKLSWSLRFQETEQMLGINKTNTQTLIELFGQFSEQWAGKQIEVFATTVEMGGRTVPCVRLRAPSQPQQPQQPQQGAGVQAAFGQQQQPPVQPNDGVPF